MRNFWKRLKNIWALGAYKVNEASIQKDFKLQKQFPTIKKKPAIIIQEPIDFFKEHD